MMISIDMLTYYDNTPTNNKFIYVYATNLLIFHLKLFICRVIYVMKIYSNYIVSNRIKADAIVCLVDTIAHTLM